MDLPSCRCATFPTGTRLRRISNPSIVGKATGHSEPRQAYDLVEIELPDGAVHKWRSHDLEPAPATMSRAKAFSEGRFGGTSSLRRTLMLERLRGDLTDVFYSMGTSKTDFYPHQFKPVLRFVESLTGRLLIADEVGLGKTIEAVLIWKELEARERARRFLIVCPSMLRGKWQKELICRFQIDAQIANAQVLRDACVAALRDPSKSFTLVASFDGLRPRSDSAKEYSPVSVRDELEDLLDQHLADPSFALFDYVIIDEAHYARNPQTKTNKLVRALNDASSYMALLTATPVQLCEDNFYQLMRLVDPDRFDDPDVFRRLQASNQPIIEAQYSLRRNPFDLEGARAAVKRARDGQMIHDPVLARASHVLAGREVTAESRIELSCAIERTSILSSSMVRSRKREVLDNRIQRDSYTLDIKLTPLERDFYGRVTRAIMDRCKSLANEGGGAIAYLSLIVRQRQMASSMAAALRIWQDNPDLYEQIFDDFGFDELEGVDGVSLKIELPDCAALERADSKYEMLRRHLQRRRETDPGEKFVLFSYFRATLAYLSERLSAEGLPTFVLQGGLPSKDALLTAFREHPGPAILLSTEVGSEGIDLQFCRTLINYDLPWNPMKVEQRIGRLDRIGQSADRIHIINLVMKETVEDRILIRLYERLGVFKRTIGDLDAILGNEVQELVLDLYRDDLNDDEREARAEQTSNAIVERTRIAGELEAHASNLIAFRDHLLDELRQSRDLGRWIEPEELRSFCADILADHYLGSRIERRHDDSLVYRVILSADAKVSLANFIARERPPRRTRMDTPGEPINTTFDPHWDGPLRPVPEFVQASHPLVLWLRDELMKNPASIYPAAAIGIRKSSVSVDPGTYVLAIDRWVVDGVRRERRLLFLGLHLETGNILAEIEAERLIQQALRDGMPLPADMLVDVQERLPRSLQKLAHEIETKFHDKVDLFVSENGSLYERQLDALSRSASRRIEALKTRLEVLRTLPADDIKRRAEPLFRAQLARAEEARDMQLIKLSASQRVRFESFDTAGVVVVVSDGL